MNNKRLLLKQLFVLFIGGCMFFLISFIHPIKVLSEQRLSWPVSSTDSDLAPCISLDSKTLIFHSNRPDGKGSFDLYESRWKNNRWGAPQNLNILNTKFYEGFPSLSADGKTLYFSTNRHTKDFRNPDLDIWMSKKSKSGKWTRPVKVANLNSLFTDKSVSVSVNNKTIYFSSNRSNGVGGYDIYYSTKNKNKKSRALWSKPKLLSNGINSKYDELNPKIMFAGDRFLFSSNRENRDVFQLYQMTRRNKKSHFENIKKLGAWVNQNNNIKYFHFSDNGSSIYYSRGKEKEENLYEKTMPKYFIPHKVIQITGSVINKELLTPIKKVKLRFIIEYPKIFFGNRFLPFKERSFITNNVGRFDFFLLKDQEFILKIDHIGYEPYRRIFNFEKYNIQKYILNIKMKSRPLNQKFNKIYFPYLKTKLSIEMKNQLDQYIDYFRTDFNKKVILFGYSSIYERKKLATKNLGYLRALEIKNYFIYKNIAKSRIKIIGQAVKGKEGIFYTKKERARFRLVEITTR